MTVSAAQIKAKPKAKYSHQGNQPLFSIPSLASRNPVQSSNQHLSTFYSCGPAVSLASPVVQAKVTIGQANDPYEREADTVADQVVQGASVTEISSIPANGLEGAPQRKESEKSDEPVAQTKLIQLKTNKQEDSESVQLKLVQRSDDSEADDIPIQTMCTDCKEEKTIHEIGVQKKADDIDEPVQGRKRRAA